MARGLGDIHSHRLVINGDEDPMVRPAAGQKIAEKVQDGRFVLVHRAGHQFSAPLWPELMGEIDWYAV